MKEKSKVAVFMLIWAAALVIFPALALAGEEDTKIFLDKLRADKKLLVATNMQLTESEAKDFWPVYARYQDELFLLRTRTANLIVEYANAYENMTEDTAKKLMEEYMNIEALGPKLRQAYLDEFRKVLPEMKVVRYYQIENKIQAALMNALAENIPLMKSGPK